MCSKSKILKDLILLEKYRTNMDDKCTISFLNKMIRKHNIGGLKPIGPDNDSKGYINHVMDTVYNDLYYKILNHKEVEFTREDYLEDYVKLCNYDKLHCLNVLNLVEGASEYVSFFNGLCMKYKLELPFVHRVSRIYEDYDGDLPIYVVTQYLNGKILI